MNETTKISIRNLDPPIKKMSKEIVNTDINNNFLFCFMH